MKTDRVDDWLQAAVSLKPQEKWRSHVLKPEKKQSKTVVNLYCVWKADGIFLLFNTSVYLTLLRAYKEVKWLKLERCLNPNLPF